MKKKDIIAEKTARLNLLRAKSTSALNLVTNTINNLSSVNEEIDTVLDEINVAKAQLTSTENDLLETKKHNSKIVAKFQNLITD